MIVDAILLLFQGILNVLLAPLSVLNIAIDFVSSIRSEERRVGKEC